MPSVPLPPPRFLLWLSAAVVVAGTVMALVGAFQTGITRDESYHVTRLDNYLHHGVYALDTAVAGDDATGSGENTSVYAPVTALVLHAGSVLLGQEGWGSVSVTPGAYDTRHLGIVLIGLLGTAAAAGIVRLLLGSWRWGLVGAAVLMALPMWTGHLMFNIKDVPVATGYTLVTLALVAMVCNEARRPLRVVLLFAGVVLMVGTRPAMVSAAVAGVLVLLGSLALTRRDALRSAVTEVAAAAVASYVVLLAVYPKVFAHPGTLLQSGEKSASFKGGATTSVGYVPFYVLAQTPLLLLLFSVIGVVVAARWVLRREPRSTGLLLVGTQLVALPLVAVVSHSDLYNGLRQLLFFAPAWAVLATLGIALVRWQRAAAAVAALALVAPMVDQAIEFPYQYTYFNAAYDAAVGTHRPYGVQTDYWRASAPELLGHIPTDGQVICGPNRTGGQARRYSTGPGRSVDCRVDPLGPLASFWKADRKPLGDTLPHAEFYAVIDNDYPLPRNCSRMSAVTRPRHGRTITMLYLARCTSGRLPALTTRPVRFAPADGHRVTADFWRYLPRGWVKHSDTGGMDAGEQSPVIAFRAPAACASGPCTLALDASGSGHLTAEVNGHETEVVASGERLLVRLPVGTRDAWITFGSALNNLRVRSISMEEGS
ncbi:MAG: hypothetical protein ACJ72O_00810 [Marmoricola sp.]